MFNQSLCLKSNHNLMVENKGYIDQVRGGGIGCAVCAATRPLFGSFIAMAFKSHRHECLKPQHLTVFCYGVNEWKSFDIDVKWQIGAKVNEIKRKQLSDSLISDKVP